MDQRNIRAQRPLAKLLPGQCGRICQIRGYAEVRNRLMEMGLTSGTLIHMVRIAPMGDPVELEVRGYRLSVRKSEAATVMIETD